MLAIQNIKNDMEENKSYLKTDEEFTKKVNKEIVEKIKKKWAKETEENNCKQKWYFKFLK